MSESSSGGGGCFGYVTFILACLLGWALLFGVTYGGRHYRVSGCDSQHGVVVGP